jgi:hypothetical protein
VLVPVAAQKNVAVEETSAVMEVVIIMMIRVMDAAKIIY